MTVKTEGQHTGAFIVDEVLAPNYCRETGTVKSGQNLVDGQVVELNGGKMIAKSTTLDTEGDFTVPVEGIIIGNWNASSTGTNADIPNVPYIKRGPMVVKDALITYPAGANPKAAAQAALLAAGIKQL